MSITLNGYNRDSTGAATQVLGAGTNLVDKNGKDIVLPAGNIVVEVRLRHLSTTPNPADGTGGAVTNAVQVRSGTMNLCQASFTELTSNDHMAVVGTGSLNAPTPSQNSQVVLKLHGLDSAGPTDGDLAANGAVFSVVIKMRPMPTL